MLRAPGGDLKAGPEDGGAFVRFCALGAEGRPSPFWPLWACTCSRRNDLDAVQRLFDPFKYY